MRVPKSYRTLAVVLALLAAVGTGALQLGGGLGKPGGGGAGNDHTQPATPESRAPARDRRDGSSARGEKQRDQWVRLGPDLERVETHKEYCRMGATSLTMDVYHPKAGAGTTPAVIFIHGGGWREGDKSAGRNAYTAALISRGFLVASVNYRLAPEHKFPAQIEDVKCAVRYLRANAGDLGIDERKIGAFGVSAGGHLSALLGLTDQSAGFDVGPWTEVSSAVQAVADLWGPNDIASHDFGRSGLSAVRETFGTDTESGSPLQYVSPSDPPFFLVHGDADALVHVAQSQRLHEKLQAAGVPSTLVIVKNAGHGLQPAGGSPSPSEAEVATRIAAFFDEHLR